MNKLLILLVAVFAIIAITTPAASAGGLSRHGESGKIKDLLKSILAKFGKGRRENKANLNRANRDLASAEREIVKARQQYEKESEEIEQNIENSASEERLIQKILSMLSNDVGKHKDHVALSCDEIFEDDTAKNGYYYVNVDGKAKKVFCARKTGKAMFSGACKDASRGNGWGRQCLNDVEFNTAADYVTVGTNGMIKIKKTGVYRITSKATVFSQGKQYHYGRILLNGKVIAFSYNYATRATEEHVKVYWPLKKGQNIQAQWYVNAGSNSERYSASDDHDGSNRLQISYEGEFDQLALYSGGCNGHRRGASWAPNCFNARDWTPPSVQAKTFAAEPNGDILIKKSGYYHFSATNMLHSSNGYSHADVRVDGKRIAYFYQWSFQWRQMHPDFSWWCNAGQKVSIKWLANGGNPYPRHSMGGNTGHNRVQVMYKGGAEAKPFLFYGGCGSHGRAKGWNNYCLNGVWRNDLAKTVSRSASSGIMTIKQSGFYRINTHGITLRKTAENASSRVLIDGKVKDLSTQYGQTGWTEMYHDLTLPLTKGQTIQLQYMGSNYAFHAWATHSFYTLEFLH